jgi:hypothetical protein
MNRRTSLPSEIHGWVVLEDVSPLLLAFAEFCFGPLAFSYVDDGTQSLNQAARGVNNVVTNAVDVLN